jgi:hypothetical protein
MDMLLAGLGMLGCLAIMAVLMPLAMRLGRRLRRTSAEHAPDSTGSVRQQAPQTAPAQESQHERG